MILESVVSGTFQIPFQLADAGEIQRILRRSRDREVDLADACLIHLANKLRAGEILTLDRDFEI
jgi:predicted nucleic acid-binding protein